MLCILDPLRALPRRCARARSGTERTRSGTHTDDAGFTIIEVMVALAIFALVAAGAVAGAIGGTKATQSSTNQVNAVNVAQNDLEQARANATPSSTSYPTQPNGNGPTYSVSRSVVIISPSNSACPFGGERHVSVLVTGPGSGNNARMDTVVAC